MQPRPLVGAAWRLAVIGGATAVGITTREPGFVVITLLGGLWLPRLLGLRGRGRWSGPCGFGRPHAERDVPAPIQQRLEEWHRQAHGDPGSQTAAT
jgi:hypothetical protein